MESSCFLTDIARLAFALVFGVKTLYFASAMLSASLWRAQIKSLPGIRYYYIPYRISSQKLIMGIFAGLYVGIYFALRKREDDLEPCTCTSPCHRICENFDENKYLFKNKN